MSDPTIIDMPQYLQKAWSKGKGAGLKGQPAKANPYMPSSQEDKWLTWEIARREHAEPRYVVRRGEQ